MAEPLGLENLLKQLDIATLYGYGPGFWDFFIYVALFYQVCKRGMAGYFAMRHRHGGVGHSFLTGAHGAEDKGLRAFSYILAIILSLVMLRQGFKLDVLIDNGIFGLIIGLMAGFFTYGLIIGNNPQKKALAIFFGMFVFAIVNSALNNQRNGILTSLGSLMLLAAVMWLFPYLFSKLNLGGQGGSFEGTGRDVGAMRDSVERTTEDVKGLAKEYAISVDTLKEAITTARYIIDKGSGWFGRMSSEDKKKLKLVLKQVPDLFMKRFDKVKKVGADFKKTDDGYAALSQDLKQLSERVKVLVGEAKKHNAFVTESEALNAKLEAAVNNFKTALPSFLTAGRSDVVHILNNHSDAIDKALKGKDSSEFKDISLITLNNQFSIALDKGKFEEALKIVAEFERRFSSLEAALSASGPDDYSAFIAALDGMSKAIENLNKELTECTDEYNMLAPKINSAKTKADVKLTLDAELKLLETGITKVVIPSLKTVNVTSQNKGEVVSALANIRGNAKNVFDKLSAIINLLPKEVEYNTVKSPVAALGGSLNTFLGLIDKLIDDIKASSIGAGDIINDGPLLSRIAAAIKDDFWNDRTAEVQAAKTELARV